MSASPTPARIEPDTCELIPGELSIVLSAHAIERYRERVRPGLELHAAAIALERLVAYGAVRNRAPDWVADRQRQRAAFYLIVGDLVFPMDPSHRDPASLRVLTCLARGAISPAARERRRRAPQGYPRRRPPDRPRKRWRQAVRARRS
jgi:hypothetical protein